MKYLKLFEIDSPIEQGCYVSYTKDTDVVKINCNQHDYSKDYLTFVAKSDGTFKFSGTTSESITNEISYSLDNGTTWSIPSNIVAIEVNSGDEVMWKGKMIPISVGGTSGYEFGIGVFSASTASFDIQGNIMSLLYDDNYIGQTSLESKTNAFTYLFSNTHIANANNLVLLATTLSDWCYTCMFKGCTNLKTAPKLQAPIMTDWCYSSMFEGCTSLTIAPELPSSTLAYNCYSSMFEGCTSLSQAPNLLAKTLALNCYQLMFARCTNINYIKMLATDISASNCLDNWVYNVSSNGLFIKASLMDTLPNGESGIPNGWSVQNV